MNLWRDDMAGWKTIANFFTTHEFFVVKAISANKSYNWRVSWATDTHSVWFNKNDLIFLLPIYTSYVHIKIKAWSVIIFSHYWSSIIPKKLQARLQKRNQLILDTNSY